jgi:hypothetical protein
MRVVYHSAVEAELIKSARFYEQKLPGLRRRFLMPRFPFGIYYRLADDELRILVVKHHRRHPGYGGERS